MTEGAPKDVLLRELAVKRPARTRVKNESFLKIRKSKKKESWHTEDNR